MGITRWDPWGEMVSLRDAMDRLMSESFVRPRGEGGGATSSLALDVHEEGDRFVVSAPVPGVKPNDVEISVLGDTVRIRGERREEREEGGEGTRWLVREQRYGAFERAVHLPMPVQADAATADFRDGVLVITLPKAEHARERRIPVRGASQGQAQEVEIDTGSQGSSTTS